MDESKKKPIMIAVIVVCFVVAVGVTFMTRSDRGGGGGIPDHYAHEYTLLLCRNPQCEHSYEVTKKEYYEFMEAFRTENPGQMVTPAMACKQCGEEGCFKATKCAKCGLLFELGSVARDFEDRCPKCKYSKIEEDRKKRAAERKAGG